MRQVRLTFLWQGRSDAKGGGVDPVNSAGAAPRGASYWIQIMARTR